MNLTSEQLAAAKKQGEPVKVLSLDEYDPDEGLAHMNELMAEDDVNDPWLESYQKYA